MREVATPSALTMRVWVTDGFSCVCVTSAQRSELSGFGPRDERDSKHFRRRAEVRSSTELGSVLRIRV